MIASLRASIPRSAAARALSGYLVSVVAVAIALAAHLHLDQYMAPGAFPFFLAAVAIAAWFGGPGPAFFAAILITLAVDVYPVLLAPQLAALTMRDAVALIAFAFVATLIIALVDSLRTSRHHALSRRFALESERGELLAVVQQLRCREREVVEADRAKSDFLATISHELRTPLTAIIGYEELLAEGVTGPVSGDQLEQLRRIKLSADHLLGLIEEVLSFSRLEAGREEVRPEPLDIARLLDDAAAIIAPLAARKGLLVRVSLPGTPLTAHADPQKLRQILVNLLSNAVKFTEHGEIAVEVQRTNGSLAIAVRDSGIGIPADQIDRVWEPFTQVDHGATRRVVGTGLGLSVSRRLARLMNGDVTVRSELGQGSVFTVHVPVMATGGAALAT